MISCKDNFDNIVSLPKEEFFFRPSVYGLIVNEGKIAILTNKSNGKYWFPGGGIEIGEEIEDALKREVREECGLEVAVEKFLFFKENYFYYQPKDSANHAFLYFYLCKPITKEFIVSENYDDEEQNPKWLEISDIKKEQLTAIEDDIFAVLQSLI